MRSDPIDEVWAAYETLKDSLKVALRMAGKGEPRFVSGTKFFGEAKATVMATIESGRELASDMAVVGAHLHERVEGEIERWRVDDLLDLLKGPVEADLVGMVKQIKSYRDWVAHRNLRRPRPAAIDPKSAHARLCEFVAAVAAADAA